MTCAATPCRRLLCLLLWLQTVPAGATLLWVEGEDAETDTMRGHGWYDSVNRDMLSGGNWLSHFHAGTPPEARFPVATPRAGTYAFWVRANPAAGARLSYRLDRGSWTEIDLSTAIERLNIAVDGKPDMRFIAWVRVGDLSLSAGSHSLQFRFHSANNNHGALDCFVLTTDPFLPRGALKPGQRTGLANPGYVAWEAPTDPFDPSALIDLRHLNEAVAGQQGRVRADGDRFRLADGRAVRFWAVNAGPGIWDLDDTSHAYLARHLAKHGVNMVRLHGAIFDGRTGAVRPQRLERLQHLVAALKTEGIYSAISFYFPAWFRLDDWHREKDRWPFMLLFFDPDMQGLYFEWARRLLTTPNPHTGLSLGEDPAVALLEIQNEDSHFFWTFKEDNCPPARWDRLKTLFAQWLADRYGSLDRALNAWGDKTRAGDAPAAGRINLLNAWHMTAQGLAQSGVPRQRITDQVRFLTANMRGFYTRAIARFRAEGHYDGLVSCGNWHTADPRLLDALERYCYTAGDVIDRHGYFDPHHEGPGASYSVRAGQTFTSASALDLARENPLPFVETAGYPHITSEIGWPMPNMYRSESSFLGAAYGALLGLDGIVHFAVGSAAWDLDVGKFILNNPVALGAYPAAALVYRRGDVTEAPPVVEEDLNVETLLDLRGTAAYLRPALDAFRAVQTPGRDTTGPAPATAVNPLAFYAGRVLRRFGAETPALRVTDLTNRIDPHGRTVTSITGQVRWDAGARLATVDTPRAQGVTGFLAAAGPQALGDVTVRLGNAYGTIWIVSLDDAPLATSRRVLIQCSTVDQPYGWRTSDPNGLSGTITAVGGAPWGFERIDAEVTLHWPGTDPVTVMACDENGYATEKATPAIRETAGVRLVIDPTTVYTVVTR